MKRIIHVAIWVAFFGIINCGIPSCRPDGGGAFSHDDAFGKRGLITADAAKLKSTIITPHLQEPLPPGQNVLWCGTFQLAWNEACFLIGEDIRLAGVPPMAAELNRKAFTRKNLDEDSYVALAGFVRDGIFDKINAALKLKFKGRATPHYLPSRDLTPRPQDIVAYAYLFKHLEFPRPFERIDRKIEFEGQEVPVFGLAEYKSGHAPLYGQVSILDYQSRDDFVIELHTKAAKDRLILAKTKPGQTLVATIQAVQKRMAAGKASAMGTGDVLAVPRVNFDLTRSYTELCGRSLLTTKPAVAKDLQVFSAVQNIRFQMDEKGVRLRSEAHMSFGCGGGGYVPEHVLLFDKPFLIMMRRSESSVPYFALWIGNADLLAQE